MTDRVLTGRYVDDLEKISKKHIPWQGMWTKELIASHRLQAARIKELEERVEKMLTDFLDAFEQAATDQREGLEAFREHRMTT